MAGFKTILLEKFEPDIRSGRIRSICDLGSGRSLNFLPLLEKYPDLHYLGVEPSAKDAAAARVNLSKFKNATVVNADGYSPASDKWGTFDLVISLSVLEHVKDLEAFLENSVAAAAPGGQIVHSWDLGHALHPSSYKERFQVWLGNNFPSLLPEHKFVRMLGPRTIEAKLSSLGVTLGPTTHHQMQDHKKFIQHVSHLNSEEMNSASKKLVEWEFEVSAHLGALREENLLKLFPTVVVRGTK